MPSPDTSSDPATALARDPEALAARLRDGLACGRRPGPAICASSMPPVA